MESNSTQQLQKFVASNNLTTDKGIILFDAIVTFYRNGNPSTIFSEIQVINLPKEMVLYVLEFVKDVYHESEVYSTRLYSFHHPADNIIEIRDSTYNDLLLFSVTPILKQENPGAY